MKKMIKIHIPTEQYGFIEVECKTLDEARDKYAEIKTLLKHNGNGLDDKTWREVVERYLTEHKMNANDYDSMSEYQKTVIQEIKRAYKRLEK